MRAHICSMSNHTGNLITNWTVFVVMLNSVRVTVIAKAYKPNQTQQTTNLHDLKLDHWPDWCCVVMVLVEAVVVAISTEIFYCLHIHREVDPP